MSTIRYARSATLLIALAGAAFLTTNIVVAQTSTPATTPYQSPFSAPHTSSPGEEADFAKLQPLYDKFQSDRAAYEASMLCGTRDDERATYGAALASSNALNSAIDSFARNWSNTLYRSKRDEDGKLPPASTVDQAAITDELARHSKKIGSPVCPPKPGAAAPPPAQPTAPPNTPPCDDGTAAAAIASAEAEMARLQRLLDITDRVADQDKHKYDVEADYSGKDSAKSQQLFKIYDRDLDKAIDLATKKGELRKKVERLRALLPCTPPNAAPQPAPPAPPPPAVPPCYDATAQADLVKSEKDLADLNSAVDKAQGDVDDDKAKLERSEKAFGPDNPDAKGYKEDLKKDQIKLANLLGNRRDLQDHIDALKALNSCPVPGTDAPRVKPSKTSNDDNGLGSILGNVAVGVTVGGGHHDDHRDSGHSDKPTKDTKAPKDDRPTDAPPPDGP